MTTSTKELITKAHQLATETWVNGEGLGGEVSETFTNIANRLRELDKPDCVFKPIPFGHGVIAYSPRCSPTDRAMDLPMKLTPFCPNCGGAVKEAT